MLQSQVLGQDITRRTSRFFVGHRPPSRLPDVTHVTLSPRPSPPFLYCKRSKLEPGTAWERGYLANSQAFTATSIWCVNIWGAGLGYSSPPYCMGGGGGGGGGPGGGLGRSSPPYYMGGGCSYSPYYMGGGVWGVLPLRIVWGQGLGCSSPPYYMGGRSGVFFPSVLYGGRSGVFFPSVLYGGGVWDVLPLRIVWRGAVWGVLILHIYVVAVKTCLYRTALFICMYPLDMIRTRNNFVPSITSTPNSHG